jgi:aldehyde:ferredoxin oxidoreductase
MKLVRINLNTESIENEEISPESKYYLLGGRGLSSQIVHEEVNPTCDPLGEKNKLIIASGLLTGSPFPNSGRSSVGAKSPLTNGIKEANVGGRPSMMLAAHGIRALILSGRSNKLKFITISDGNLRFESAEEYKGFGNYELHERLREKYGERIGIYSIGPAGEMMLKNASVAANDLEGYPSRHAARGGLGAVMGSKNIKAIIIIPPKSSMVKFHDLKRFRGLTKPFAQYLAESREVFSRYGTPLLMKAVSSYGAIPTKSFRMGSYNEIEDISGEKLHELVLARGGKKRIACCPTCAIKCSNIIVDEHGNHLTSSLEYETMALNGSNCMINNLDSLAKIDQSCDDIGIDTIEFGVTMGVAMDSGRVKWGDAEKVLEILEEIRRGSEVGKIYGNGVCHLGKEIGYERIPQVKGQGISGYDPRVFKGMSVAYATSPMGADHTSGAAIAGRTARSDRDYGELTEDEQKLELSYELQIFTTVLDSMGVCYFVGPSYKNMELVSNAINAMYGTNLSRDDVINIGKNVIRNELEFNDKAGITKSMNDLPNFFREEPSNPIDLTVSISKKEFADFWNRLEE